MKKFFSAFLLMTAMVLSVGTFVACNDLTEEMETVQTQATSNAAAIKALGDQITALQQALATANGEIEKAKAAGEEAKTAAAQAKADAIKEAKAECEVVKAALEAKINENAQGLKDLTALLNSKIAGIDEKLAKMATVAQVETAVADLVKADTEIKTQIAALQKYAADSLATIAQLEGLREDLTAVAEENFNTLYQLIGTNTSFIQSLIFDVDTVKTDLYAYIESNDKVVGELSKTLNTVVEDLDILKGDVKKLQDGLKALEGRMTAAEAAIVKINADLVTLKTFVEKSLRSLVFIPELYVDGIEATEYTYMPYVELKNPTTATTVITGQDERSVDYKILNKPADWEFQATTAPLYKNPVHYVSYFVNPDNADLTGAQLAFISKDVQAITKASAAAPIVDGAFQMVTVEDGTTKEVRNAVRVPMTVKGQLVKGVKNASIFALNADVVRNGADTTVSSDFANLYASTLTLDAIAYAKANDAVDCAKRGNDHLYATAHDALKKAPTLFVKYDGSIDLREAIETHFTITSKSNKAVEHAVYEKVYMKKETPAAEQNPYGLKWNFKLIDYTSGTNATSDSQHCTLNGSVLTPCGVTNGEANGVANPVSIGRRPLVRVTVTDEAGKIVLVGFIKLEITQQVAYQEALPTSFDVKFGCSDAVLKQTWAQFVDNVLDYTTDLSKEQFAAIYELETVGTTAVQYVKDNNKFAKATAAEVLGTVTEVSENYGTTTNVLTWTIPSTGQERVFEAEGETIYVRYIYKDSTPTTEYEGIYVPFTVTVTKPVGKVSRKISEYWFNGEANAIINVARPTDNGSTYDWVTYINQVWEKNAPKFNQTAGYASYNTLTYKYYFSPVQPKLTVAGVDYQLVTDSQKLAIKSGYNYFNVTIPEIKDNAKIAEYENSYAIDADKEIYKNNKLYAAYKATPTATTLTKVHIATIDQTNSTVTYEHNAIAELLLNAFASVPREDAKLFANIGVVAANTCGIALSLTENETNPYYFLRPLNIYAIDGAQFEDGEANGSKVNVIDLFNITDWRNVTFVTPTYKNIWLFAYYNVKNVFVDVENAMCDLNQADGSFVKMSDITSFIGLEHIGSKVTNGVMTDLDYTGYNSADKSTAAIYEKYVKAFGQISYKNNGNNVDGFQIKVPVTFTYDWGKATIDVVIPVVKTMGN